MVGLNKIMVIGNIGTDPELRYTPAGNPVCSYRIAASRTYTGSDGEKKQETEWFTVVTWNQLAEQCNQYLVKGRRAYVEGRLHSTQWDGNDGQVRHNNEIVASRVLFLDRANPDSGSVMNDSIRTTSDQNIADLPADTLDPDDLPF
jgi:single-strand DNA-binding protein